MREDEEYERELDDEEEEIDDIDPEKAARREKEKEKLLSTLASGNLDTLISKVAYIMNNYKETRNSDMALKIKFWNVFQGFTGNMVDVNKLFELERDTSIARARAKIQNEYKLFSSEDRIKRFRKGKEEVEKEIQIATKPGRPTINIFADESGKTGKDKFMIIGGLWILDRGRVESLRKHFIQWKLDNNELEKLPREFHFTEISKNQLDVYKKLFTEVLSVSDMMGFKAVVTEKANKNKTLDEMVYAMFYQHVHHGIEHEVNSGRITLPRGVNFWKDKEEGNDALYLSELKQHLVSNFKTYFDDNLELDIFSPADSIANIFIQLADLYTGSINRILNNTNQGSRNQKDEFAEFVMDMLGLDLTTLKNQESDMAMVHFL